MKFFLRFLLCCFIYVSLSSCSKDDDQPEYEFSEIESVDGQSSWNFNSQADTSGPGSSNTDSNVTGSVLKLLANGCANIDASTPLTSSILQNGSYGNLRIVVKVNEFNASPVISEQNMINIAFSGFNLSIKPIDNFSDKNFVFYYNTDSNSLTGGNGPIEYTFNTNSIENRVHINLQSASIGDCTASAEIEFEGVEISNFY
ncbi:hypothetical protein [Salibacter halophilus]|uniref:Uncharacterized protein n=1 Tax=Salibacter halophilus TaxID=1803916 RepID=A0A6N6M8I3_9FLAO|nr:hypothetical protein [Salibacter halophilus]KAB1064404.1 hypothetical protein F3059_06795 [Salibacter halophilus]